jgi:hypothetical protein
MTISSRTPEGDPNTCPVCGHDLRIEPSLTTRDGTCPYCGTLLWFSVEPNHPGKHDSFCAEDLANMFVDLGVNQPVNDNLKDLANLVLNLGTEKFGPPTPAVKTRIAEVSDRNLLCFILLRLAEAASWKELVAAK